MRKTVKFSKRIGVSALLVPFLAMAQPLPAHAGMVTTEAVLSAGQRSVNAAKVSEALEREGVRERMIALGVDPAEARARVAALGDAELARLAAGIDSLPAGGGVIEVVGIVFIVLLILELLGVTNVFTKI